MPKPAPERSRLTLADVAASLGVSRTTVSNAFNRPEQLSKDLREEILARSRELGYYGPDMMARALRRRELREVAVVFHHDLRYAFGDELSLDFLRGVTRQLDLRGLSLQLIPKLGRQLLLQAAFQTTADALIVHAEIGPEIVPQVQAAHKPIVLVDTQVPGTPSVCLDDRQGAALAMGHALAARPDAVLVIGFPQDEAERARALCPDPARSPFITSERLSGYAHAVRAHGFDARRVFWAHVDDSEPEAAAAQAAQSMRAALAPYRRLALVAMSDRMALAARAVIVDWPGTALVATVGFDDIAAARTAGLTTVRQNAIAKGETAVRIVLDGEPSALLPLELIVRDT